jgi:uncharacterized membrane protein YedE/YeeE
MRNIVAFVVGGLFGAGLLLSGMTNTQKVQGWLDVFGDWDPTLAFVMGGAIIPMAIAWQLTKGRRPVLGGEFDATPDPVVDRRIVIGSVMFGIGWGLVGLCPGPAIASLTFGGIGGVVFMIAMIAGMIVAPKLHDTLA